MNAKIELDHLLAQHPNPRTRGQWYKAATKAGRDCQIKKTTAVKTGVHYLHIRYRGTVAIKTTTGEIMDRREEWIYYRANLKTYELKGM
jgi:hypothetical protein